MAKGIKQIYPYFKINANGNVPTKRRRQTATAIGEEMITFGGFNGEYFSDMNFVELEVKYF
jgi:hypothetical protein